MAQLKESLVAFSVMAIATATQTIAPAQAIAHTPVQAGAGAAPAAQQGTPILKLPVDGSFASSQVAPGRLEVTFSGQRFESQNPVELYLLYRAALLAKKNGASWFGLLYLPGEAGSDSHPAHSNGPGELHYGHWQPHWNYYVSGLGWQPWHPEWGVAFWAKGIDLSLVTRYDTHAIIELGINRRPAKDQPIFEVDEVIKSLRPAFGSQSLRSQSASRRTMPAASRLIRRMKST